MVFFILIVVFLFVIIAFFASPQLSPIPYFPSNKKDLRLILKALRLTNNQTIIDLGAGSGTVIFNAASQAYENDLDTRFIATEINPMLLIVLYIRKLLHQNKQNIRIGYADMFTMDFSFLHSQFSILNPVFYLYISPWYLDKTVKNIQKQLPHCTIVSYMYQVPYLSGFEKKHMAKVHPIYVYKLE